ncbi:MAG: hemolysin III family protein [Thermacetogeniaceae bacterium]
MSNFLNMKEPVNTWTHFATFLAAIAGLVFIVAMTHRDAARLIPMTIYGVSVITLFGASSLYHWAKTTPPRELLLKKLDHVSIYFLIAGSYTPLFYFALSGSWRWAMLGAVWGVAVIGMLIKLWFIGLPRWISTVFYLLMGWIAIVPFVQLAHTLSHLVLSLMIGGGVAYSAGAVIYATKCCNFWPRRFGFHEIFHLFVSAGCVTHFIMMLVLVGLIRL